MIKNKKTFLALAVIFSFASIVYVSQAGTSESGMGWLWGGSDNGFGSDTGVGWVSLNDLNCDADKNGFKDAVCGGDNMATAMVPFGVNIPEADGLLSGYAWSENIGWISFNGADLAGCAGATPAQRSGNSIQGWARILSIKTEAEKIPANAGGWLGCIKLAGANYGASINPDNTLSGYAWSDELGWIDFSRASINIPKTIIATVSASPNLVASPATKVSITAAISGGTASGSDIKYELDCTDDGTIEDSYQSVTGETNHSFPGACTYGQNESVSVRITRDSAVITPTAQIIYGCIDSVCQDYECVTQIKSDPADCDSTCDETTNCKKPLDLNWKEVNPND